MKFEGKVVLISGGTRGIGKATSIEFAREGASLVLLYQKDKDSADQTLSEMPGANHKAYQCDISKAENLQHTVLEILNDFGKVNILVNNAAFHEDHPIDECSFEEWQFQWNKTLEVNLIGAANLTYLVSKAMIESGGGKIIFVSSRGAFRGEPDMPAYGASKAGLNAFAQSMAKKLAPKNIHIGVVAPGFVETDLSKVKLDGPKGPSIKAQSPMNRVAKPSEVAHAILFFADEKSIWSTGAILDLNGASYLRT